MQSVAPIAISLASLCKTGIPSVHEKDNKAAAESASFYL